VGINATISATDVADEDAERRTSEEFEPEVEAPPSSAGDRARAKFDAIVPVVAKRGPRAFGLPEPAGFEDEEACDPDMDSGIERVAGKELAFEYSTQPASRGEAWITPMPGGSSMFR